MDKKTFNAIASVIIKDGSMDAFRDMMAFIEEAYKKDGQKISDEIMFLRVESEKALRKAINDEDWARCEFLEDIYYRTFKVEALDIFDSFCIYLEHKRPANEKFYEPRRRVLMPITHSLQELTDGKLDELGISQPPRTGKTTIVMFYCLFMMARNPELTNLYVSYSDIITGAFYDGIIELIDDKHTYSFDDMVPGLLLPSRGNGLVNAKDETIDLGRKKRYPSLTCRSLYGTLNGACDARGILIGDDLIGSIEEALSPDRLNSAWSKVDNNMIPRSQEHCKLLWIGTRWSIYDPEGRRFDMLREDPQFANRKWRFLNLPALDENDESNFNYDCGLGFSTEYYHQRRASFERNDDTASWLAQYQGEPIEREGVLFTAGNLNYFDGTLPDGEPDRKFMVVDPAFGGGDYVSSPVCYQYGDDVYIMDVVFDPLDKSFTQPKLAHMAKKWDIHQMQIEANKSTQDYAQGVIDSLKKINHRCQVRTKPAPPNKSKEVRIFDTAPEIRENFYFLREGKRSNEYQLFMSNLLSFTITGKNKHDDAPDSLSMAVGFAFKQTGGVKVFKRPF